MTVQLDLLLLHADSVEIKTRAIRLLRNRDPFMSYIVVEAREEVTAPRVMKR